ncbi:RnfH family protein [Herminiimonas sp.]|uniref:RnfH family protein n=1 Tax=Herminiimonas sp. TaxID=1926289 RepID=UPI00271C300B|nr:RnfH family protein [Herminiimonas sp.]MDO8305225.1 RnfH family protein [Herminiimonas sp.]MDO9217737.1 RnfH family protein [Lacisediminimonas sp.]
MTDPAPDQETVRVEVCYATPERVFLHELRVAPGTSLQQAIGACGLLQQLPGLDLGVLKVGVHGKLRPLDAAVREGDRIEIYRPLVADPKDARRRRAVKAARSKP